MPDAPSVRFSRPARVRAAALLGAGLVFVGVNLLWARSEEELRTGSVVVFSEALPGCPIILPAQPLAQERSAAEILQATLAKASGLTAKNFPIFNEGAYAPRRAIFVGATTRARALAWPDRRSAPLDTRVAREAGGGRLVVRAERREAAEVAVAWFLEDQLGAHWFMPGPLGEHVPRRAELALAGGGALAEPGFVSRDVWVDADGQDWYRRNRLEARFHHQHNLLNIFRPDDLLQNPELAAMRHGRRQLPAGPGDYNWQPDLTHPAVARHAAEAAKRAFEADPRLLSFSLSMNDSVRFDDSMATTEAVAPARFFRGRPDYSDLIFGFTNRVAESVAATYPDRYLPAYAYYWAENTPRFPVARTVVPFLTADRSQWFDPAFAAEDRALVERWVRSGAQFVGAYEYFEGAPQLVPKPMLFAIKQSIPFLYRAGVRAYFAEGLSNWALEGPKGWLAAQLLWAPARNPDELLDIYYRECWAEAAAPMRAFFAAADEAWLTQPRPGAWLKYFQDEHQALLFPPARRTVMRAALEEAGRLASNETTRARVEFVSAGFSVSERFAEFCETRDALARLTQTDAEPAAVMAGWRSYRGALAALRARFAEVRQAHPLAISATRSHFENLTRSAPDGRAAWMLLQSEAGRARLAEALEADWLGPGIGLADLERLAAGGIESLSDPTWKTVTKIRDTSSATTLDWSDPGSPWRSMGEPREGRTVEIADEAEGRRVLRFANARTELLSQWAVATGGALYVAQVEVRGRVSPGAAPYLLVSFLDEKQRHIGYGHLDRLPPGEGIQQARLSVLVRAPKEARYIGFGVRVLEQTPGDFAEFSGATLKRLP